MNLNEDAKTQDSHERLNQEDTAKYRAVAGSFLYLSLDRPDIQCSAGHVIVGMACPTVVDMARLKQLCLYLRSNASCARLFKHQ
eukprot:780594-Amphidinium_carterae.2